MFPDARPPSNPISSWKEIAAHFRVTVRTVQLWEEQRGLPVRRMPGVKGRVYAIQEELDAWEKTTFGIGQAAQAGAPEQRPAQHWKRWIVAACAAAGLLLVGAAASMLRPAPKVVPSTWSLKGRTLVIKDAKGMVAWTHEFPEAPDQTWENRNSVIGFPLTEPRVGDFDGDGNREVLFSYTIDRRAGIESELYCFESDGRIRWKYTPGRTVATRKESFPPPYVVRLVLPVPPQPGKPPLLIVVGTHSMYYPSQVAAINPQGKVVREYWHSGHLNDGGFADLGDSGKLLLYMTGAHNATKSTAIVALDPTSFGGASRESNPDYQLLGMGEPREAGRVVLPASELTRRTSGVTSPSGIRFLQGKLIVSISQGRLGEADEGSPCVLYEFGPGLRLAGIEYCWTFKSFFDENIRTGKARPYDMDADLERMRQVDMTTPWRDSAGN